MDQDNSKGQDKRNWRERLGIGAQGGKDLPKISDDFRKEPAPAAARPPMVSRANPRPIAAAAVRPAPMAPRATAKPASTAPVAPDKLAERLRSQREASSRMAEQRVQVAKQRAEVAVAPPPPLPTKAPVAAGPKPKFTFAEEANGAAAPTSSARPASPQPPIQQQPQLSPARPPLGGGMPQNPTPVFQPRPQVPQYQPQQNYQPQAVPPMGYPQQYNQQPVPPYRPIDPNSGYAPPPGYVPQQRGFQPPPGQFMPPQGGPRLNMPARPAALGNPNFQPQQDFGAAQPQGFGAPPSRVARPPLRAPAPLPQDEEVFEDEYEDAAAARGNRRPTTNDYQQAYREAEYGYEDESPRSKAPWILAGLLLLALLVAGLGVWVYLNSVKPLLSGQTTQQEVPAVAAPETPAKVQAEQPAAEALATPAVATPSKKQIYDRIVGDKEVLGGELAPVEEAPAAIPEPTNEAAPAPAGGGGEDAAPLPIPPPPGGTGEQQGSLDPASQKQSAENITPAAGESQAAVAASGGPETLDAPQADAPVPGEIEKVGATPSAPAAEEIVDPVPVKKKVVAAKKKVETEKKVATRSLGAKPVVLVPAGKKPVGAAKRPVIAAEEKVAAVGEGEGIYGAGEAAPEEVIAPPPATAVKKKKTLADLFKGEDAAADTTPEVAAIEPAPKPVAPIKKPQVAAPAPQQQASAGGYAVQLASFRSRNEATAEFGRLKAKHSGTLSRFTPIISEAVVGGSTRYRLSVGGMGSQAQANAVCSSLFAGGERDCLVKRQ